MEFRKYQHIERLGTSEVEGILIGKCYLFFKIDGTNASVWVNENREIQAGSRKRHLTVGDDNANFYNTIKDNKNIKDYLNKYPTHRLYGEWLVKHSLKTYRDDAWRKFYIFDVTEDLDGETSKYLSYDEYMPLLEEFGLDYIPPILTVKNPTVEFVYKCLEKTGDFLIEDGKGLGEGLVIKNYGYRNKYGRQTWAKVVRTEFKEKHGKAVGVPNVEIGEMTEIKIVNNFCTPSFIEKEYSKLLLSNNGDWSSRLIPQLIGRIYYELIVEESWNMVKKYNNPTINYKTLYGFVVRKIKEVKSELF